MNLKTIVFAACIAGFMIFQPVQAQFSVIDNLPSLNELSGVYDRVSYHENSPDSLTNHLNDSIMVHIRGANGMIFAGLQEKKPSTPARTFSVLKGAETAEINVSKLRQGSGQQNKTELILTIPGVKVGQGGWDLKPVKWTLGETDHQPTFTQIKYLGGKKGYQIIFIYENGLPKTKPNLKNEAEGAEESLMFHMDAHVCLPNDPACF